MSMKKRTLSLLLAAVMVASMALTACKDKVTSSSSSDGAGSSSTDNTSSKDTTKVLYPGTPEAGTAVINIRTEPPQLCSILATDVVSMNILRHISDGLVLLDQQDKPIPGVAKDWTISEDKLTYTFNLRDDYKWTNGEKVTAKDFEFAFKALIDPKFGASYASFGYCFENAQEFADHMTYKTLKGKAKLTEEDKKTITLLEKNYNGAPKEVKLDDVGVKAIDEKTLELKLKQPVPYLLDMLAFAAFLPVNQKAYDAVGDKYGTDSKNMAFNGAYIISEWSHENSVVLTKNPDYPMASDIKIEKIVMKMVNDPNAAMNALKNGELDMINLNGNQYAQMKAEGQPTFSFDDASNWYFEFNLNNPTFANAKLRRALTLAIDTETFVKNIVKNESIPAHQFTPKIINGNKGSFASEVGELFSYDLEEAKKLIEEAKKELNIDKISVTLLSDDGETAAQHSAYIQEAWKTGLGIDAKVEIVPFKTRIARTQAHDFEIAMAGWSPDYNDPMTFLDLFETGNGNNHTSYSNPEYDELLDKVRAESDRDKRFGYLMDLEKLLMTDMPIGPYYFRATNYTTTGKLSGLVRTAFQDLNMKWAEVK